MLKRYGNDDYYVILKESDVEGYLVECEIPEWAKLYWTPDYNDANAAFLARLKVLYKRFNGVDW